MDNMTLGVIITIIGMIVTLLTLFILMLVIRLLSRMFPHKEEAEEKS